MVLRINVKTGTVTPLDNAVENRPDDLTELVKERIALLKIAEAGDIVDNVGTRLDDDTYVVHEK